MPSITSSRNKSRPLPIDSPVMAPEPTPTPPSWTLQNTHNTQSKTSQYIDKITAENEKLKRELRAEKLAREDDSQRVAAARTRAEDTERELQRLTYENATNSRALERKDRKLKELEARVEAEAQRRRQAEQRSEEALRMLSDTRSNTQRQLAQAYEEKIMAETNLSVAKDGFKRNKEGYDRKFVRFNTDIKGLSRRIDESEDQIKRHVVVTDALTKETPRHKALENRLEDALGEYKREHRKEVDALVKEAERMRSTSQKKDLENEKLARELKETLDKMKWVMAQQRRQSPT
ncbi:hypothetical protein CC80DRAFT_490132 [Byssothecium circinans]|uniref:SWI5-dependent HO expression protein 3 n=1 Tax=Byssothecium circinans TaxID=147558 RepID=A0A6A5U5C7_9PLEO|nr:hypothetical protein CC80DRAFT_490132 [Byssothecium circinans]